MTRSFPLRAGIAALALLACTSLPAAAQNSYKPAGPMNSPRDLHTATPLADGTVLIAGGEDALHVFGALNTAEIYDPATATFTNTTNTMSAMRAQHTATRLADGRVLLAGGEATDCCTSLGNYGSRPTAASDVYDPATHAFTATASMAQARYDHSATRLADGRVLITGGITDIETIGFSVADTAEIFDPATGTYSPGGTMTTPRYDHTSVLLPDKTVLIVGGGQSQTTAEIYQPATATFAPTAHQPLHPEAGAAAFVLENGTVLLIGSAQAVEIYDPATQTFSDGGQTIFSYPFWTGIARLTNGQILLASSHQSELFDPATHTSVSAGDPGVGDLFPAAAPLASNKVLVTGGQTFVPFTFVASAAASVLTPDRPPVADPGPNRTAAPGANCTALVALDGSASTDPDNDTLTYSWTEGTTVLGTSVAITVPLGLGVHTITLTVDDGHGGTNSKDVTITVADTIGPTFTPPTNVILEQAGPGGTVYTPALPVAVDNCDANPSIGVSGVPAGSLFPAGTTALTYSATDASGNNTSAITTVTVLDRTAPALQLPSAIVAEATGPQGATVTYAATATDAVTPAIAVTCAPASGATFPLGATIVSCGAFDGADNHAAGTFTVTVRDTTPPAITITAPSAVAYGLMQTVPADYACADIGSGIASCVGSVPLGNPIDTTAVGLHLFTVTAVDRAGRSSSASVSYTVTALPGRMSGSGAVVQNGLRGQFKFTAENDGRDEASSLIVSVVSADGNETAPLVFTASGAAPAFWNDPAVDAGHTPKTMVDSMVLAGAGELNGVAGYRFEARASDHGEPGVGHDTFTIAVYAADNSVVLTLGGTIAEGNIQSLPVKGQ